MIINPLAPVWLLVLLSLALVGFATWRLIVASRSSLRLAWALRIVMVVLLLVIAIRPTIPADGTGPRASGGLEVWFAVDTTSSMAAEDYGTDAATGAAATRLSGVKADIAAITEKLNGAQFSLVTFDSAAVQRVPLTSDGAAVESAASVLKQEVTLYSHGSSIDEAVPELTTLLEASETAHPGNRRVLFYFGDGEQTTDAAPGSFADLTPLIDGGGVLGYGTTAGGRMQENSGQLYVDPSAPVEPPVYIQDRSGAQPTDALSVIDQEALGTIADQLGVPFTLRVPQAPVDPVIGDLEVGELVIEPGDPGGPTELYWIPGILLGLLALAELVRVLAAVSEVRRASAGLSAGLPAAASEPARSDA